MKNAKNTKYGRWQAGLYTKPDSRGRYSIHNLGYFDTAEQAADAGAAALATTLGAMTFTVTPEYVPGQPGVGYILGSPVQLTGVDPHKAMLDRICPQPGGKGRRL